MGAIYLADSPDTAWAEWYRQLAERGIPPVQGMPRDLWRWQVDLPRVADLRSTTALRAHAVDAPRPRSSDWSGFQRVGEALQAAGWPALVAPSAARPSGFVLCVFRTSDRPDGVEPVSPPERIDSPPVPPRGMTT